ncbi:PAS domain-containing protein [Streptomyces rubrolavendulae]|uniref:PAS fold protein n=1 Tax=Streptomyces rubrolavendulae TaxID=285473 RepID=A0A1D8G9D8_9ACTN|nr:PAS domain-containing protein [Streptomyces rubrolavendulae]AOT62056.1 PAS fold protein [Streptomyces rubrolavendulae]
MSETGSFGEDLADFVRRVGALRGSRALPAAELRGVLDAALFELEHAAETLWPRYERLAARAPEGTSAERRERQLLRAVFQRLPLPVVLVDRDTAVRRMNPAATALTGVRAGYATGRPLAGLLAPGDRAPFRSQVAAAARGEGARSLTVRLLQRPDEPVRATLTALSPPGEPQRTVVLVLQPGVPGGGAGAGAGAGTGTGSGAVPGVARPGGGRAPSAAGAGTAAGAGAASGAPGRPGGVPERPGGVPGLAEATERAGALDLVDAVATALLRTAPGDARGALEAAARVLHGRFADWVVADLCPEGPDGPLRRAAVLGPRDGDTQAARALAAQDPASCPLVVEVAAGGSASLQVRPENALALGTGADGAAVLVRAGVGSLLCLPVVAAGPAPDGGAAGAAGPRVLGVLTLLRCGARRAFSIAEAHAADVLSRHVGLAMCRPVGPGGLGGTGCAGCAGGTG